MTPTVDIVLPCLDEATAPPSFPSRGALRCRGVRRLLAATADLVGVLDGEA